MNKQLFPKEIIENSQEANFSKHSVTSKTIYSIIVMFLICTLCFLPLIHVDVGVRSQGLIRPVTEVVQLLAPVSGHIQTLNATENSFIMRGEVFAVLDDPGLTERIRFNNERRKQLSKFISDLDILQYADSLSLITSMELNSPRYHRAWLEFRQQLLNQKQEIDRMYRQLTRDKILFERKAISEATLDESFYSWQIAANQFKLLVEQQQNQWKLDKITFQNELDQLWSEHTQLKQELRRAEIRSPITGTVQNRASIFQNSFVHANQVLGEISPDTILVAEVYVSPEDIGLLREDMPVRMQIDAYNYNQWGVLTGNIEGISTDVTMNEGQPLFRVRCSLDQTYLELQNGFQGDIKKGMTFQARFIVSRRSLFQLLYDKVDDWLNPTWAGNE